MSGNYAHSLHYICLFCFDYVWFMENANKRKQGGKVEEKKALSWET